MYMMGEDETPKVSKTEEKESYIKQLRESVDEIKSFVMKFRAKGKNTKNLKLGKFLAERQMAESSQSL